MDDVGSLKEKRGGCKNSDAVGISINQLYKRPKEEFQQTRLDAVKRLRKPGSFVFITDHGFSEDFCEVVCPPFFSVGCSDQQQSWTHSHVLQMSVVVSGPEFPSCSPTAAAAVTPIHTKDTVVGTPGSVKCWV